MLNSDIRRRALVVAAAGLAAGAIGPARANPLDTAKDLLFGSGALSDDDIASGLREALKVGSERVVAQVGRLDGFNADPKIHIPLPGALRDVQAALKPFGLSSLADDLETRLNRAAEQAAPEAKTLFWGAIKEMTLDDARRIYDGPDDAATQYFKGTMSKPLRKRMRPIVSDNLDQVGAVRSYDAMMDEYRAIPFVPDVKSDLTSYVVRKGLDGIFFYVAEEERKIRRDPAARTTELLRKVFGGA